ncbi:MAG: helix-turn-helix domain-containing protein [Spirochaetaceae bacterium]|jgi:AraC-like DNA-binding protein|nr:helix-turn-helix domain-containing protein [Spirochaetaceae bacterium]
MSISNLIENMHGSSPPFQPSINMQVYNYREKVIDWNILSVKKGALCYQFKTGPNADECSIQLLPDACLNILFECDRNHPKALFSGFFFKPNQLVLKPETKYFGFKPYSSLGYKIGACSVNELLNMSVDFASICPNAERLVEKISVTDDFNAQIALFNEFSNVEIINRNHTPTFVDYITLIICASKGNILFNNLQRILGYSERYIREKFKDTYGFSPKRYSNVMRFQNILKKLLLTKYYDLPSLAVDNGYFDQSHFIHEFQQFVSMPPEKYRKNFHTFLKKSLNKGGCRI